MTTNFQPVPHLYTQPATLVVAGPSRGTDEPTDGTQSARPPHGRTSVDCPESTKPGTTVPESPAPQTRGAFLSGVDKRHQTQP